MSDGRWAGRLKKWAAVVMLGSEVRYTNTIKYILYMYIYVYVYTRLFVYRLSIFISILICGYM